jgi:hypothetical protein
MSSLFPFQGVFLMRWLSLRLLLACVLLPVGLRTNSAEEKKDAEGFKPLFNGKDLKGWSFVLQGKETEPGTTFIVKDEMLVISGKPFGYCVTEARFKNYVIKYDWKYTRPSDLNDEEAFTGNSGLLIHIQGLPDKGTWPKCVEIQGMNRNHGQLLNVSGAKGGPYKFDKEALVKARMPVGQWNTTEASIMDGSIIVKVNGAEVASGKCELTEGLIGFQSEGAELSLKNILVKELR